MAPSPVLTALMGHRVSANVQDLDMYRKGGVTVETDYIICVENPTGEEFLPFCISKTFYAFRNLAEELKDLADAVMAEEWSKEGKTPKNITSLAHCCHAMSRLCDAQRAEYIGKMNYKYVQALSKERSRTLDDILDLILTSFPKDISGHPFSKNVAEKIEEFFLTDHIEGGAPKKSEKKPPTPKLVEEAKATASKSKDMATDAKDYLKKNLFNPIMNPVKKEILDPMKKNINSAIGTVKDTVDSASDKIKTTMKGEAVVPKSLKKRLTASSREMEEKELCEAGKERSLEVEDIKEAALEEPEESTASAPAIASSWISVVMDEKPLLSLAILAGALQALKLATGASLTLDIDYLVLAVVAAYSLGYYTPHPDANRKAGKAVGGKGVMPSDPVLARQLTKQGVAAAPTIESPMPKFPDGAKLGSVLGCWSEPPSTVFHVRGDNYLSDKKKVESGPFHFPTRGTDLFLTDACPENVGSISSLLKGKLRDKPTFIVNFRLPWGVFLSYSEIPEKFVPFIKASYGDASVKKSELEKQIKEMNNQDRCCARFLMGDMQHKNNNLKLFPMVVQGPWVVKSVVGGKPAIIGTKLPVNYVYEPESEGADGKKRCLYLEADLDIVSSSAARSILSVVRSYTQDLTIDLGFGIQGNSKDELREQMLTGVRIHGLDPLNAPPLPPMKSAVLLPEGDESDSEEG